MGEFLEEHGLVCVHSQNTFIELPSRSLGGSMNKTGKIMDPMGLMF